MAEDRIKELAEKRKQAIDAINQTFKGEQVDPINNTKLVIQVWLEATNLKVRHQKNPSWRPKRYGPFPITKKYPQWRNQLTLPATLANSRRLPRLALIPYHENDAHGPNLLPTITRPD